MNELVSEIDLRPEHVSVGTVTYPPVGTLGPRRQRDLQLVLVHSGSARVWVDGVERRIDAGEVGLLRPGHRERFEFDREVPTRHSWVQGRVRQWADSLPDVLPASGSLEALVREAVAAAGSALPTAPLVVAQLAAAAFWQYAGEARRSGPEQRRPADDLMRFIHANLADPDVTLEQIARAGHVTPTHAIRSFRAEHGITPKAYLWQRRTALGMELLATTGLPIAAIAERCGFRTTQHFSRRVKEASGLAPGALRRARWAG